MGTLHGILEENPALLGCEPPGGRITFEFTTGSQIITRFTTHYYYEDGIDETGDPYEFAPEKAVIFHWIKIKNG